MNSFKSFINTYGDIKMVLDNYETRNVVYVGDVKNKAFGDQVYAEIRVNSKNRENLKIVETLQSIVNILNEKDIMSVALIDSMGNIIYEHEN